MYKSGMLIGGHSFSHKLFKNLNYSDQKFEIEKNINHLNSLIKSRLEFFAYPYGGKTSYNKNTISILKRIRLNIYLTRGTKKITENSNNNYLPRMNCNKFEFGQIYKF